MYTITQWIEEGRPDLCGGEFFGGYFYSSPEAVEAAMRLEVFYERVCEDDYRSYEHGLDWC